jgi:hypothetical protein
MQLTRKKCRFGCANACLPSGRGRIDRSAVLERYGSADQTPIITEMDLIRARRIVRALASLKRLSCNDAEIVAWAIAGSFAESRQRGLHIAKFDLQACSARAFECGASAV